MSTLDAIRAACREVAGRARLVRVDEGRIPACAAALPLDQIARPEHDPHAHVLGRGDETVAFFLTLDAINFGSGFFPHLAKRPGRSGYFTIATALRERFDAGGPIPAAHLARISAEECCVLFGQNPANSPIFELMNLFAQALRDLGVLLLNQYDGSFTRLVAAANGSAETLVGLLAQMPLYQDVSQYDGLAVPLYKRAQLSAADLWIAFGGQGPGHFDDLARLTIFADNLVPHVLRLDGVLHYDEKLAARIDAEELIPAGSPEEVELRACAVHAVELMVAALRAVGQPISAMQLDYLLWNRGQQPAYKQAKPRHRTRSVFY
jgi:hypothetical protein